MRTVALSRKEFDRAWSIGEYRCPDEVTQYCNMLIAEMEPQFKDSPTYEQMSEYYLVPRKEGA